MTTKYKLNTLIEWTDEDRAKGECPVPDGSDVTLWFYDMDPYRPADPVSYEWGNIREAYITAYLIHSVPREPIVRWLAIAGSYEELSHTESYARELVLGYGGRVVKLVEDKG